MDNYTLGKTNAYIQMGLLKESSVVNTVEAVGKELVHNGTKFNLGRSILKGGQGLRKMLIGEPTRAFKEIRNGDALAHNSLIRKSYEAKDVLSKGMFYGLPGYEAGSVLMDDKDQKAKRMGVGLAAGLGSFAAFRPLGLAGVMGLDYGIRSGLNSALGVNKENQE